MANRFITYLKLHKVSLILAFISMVFYYTFAFHLERSDFPKLLSLFAGLFFLCYKLIQFEKWNLSFLFSIGLLSRLIFLFTEPSLSQDFYRFIWDGELVRNFMNPYVAVPNTLISQPDLVISNAEQLYQGMGGLSAKHFSNYPPLNQLLFALATFLGGKSVLGAIIGLRSIIILADIGIFYFGRKLLKKLNRSPHLIFWYFLNPLILIELTGNLHFEGVMLFFFVWSIYLISINKWRWAGVVLACSISIKLVPLLFLPLFLKYFNFKRTVIFYVIIGATSLLLFAPFYSSEFIANYSKTIGLWFSNFEFNASLWNVVKQIGIEFDAKPWELIKTYGKITPILTVCIVLLFTFLRKNQDLPTLLSSMLWILTLYYFLSAIVHPWYITFLVMLTIFTSFRYALVWSLVVILSYFAYSQIDFNENLYLLVIEYIAVLGFIIYEIGTHRNKS